MDGGREKIGFHEGQILTTEFTCQNQCPIMNIMSTIKCRLCIRVSRQMLNAPFPKLR
jgi:hypothetical protein